MIAKILYVWKCRTRQIRMATYTILLAYKDPRVPWYAKLLLACIAGYLFSPIDKLLDSIPIIGYLDHLLFVPIGVAWAFRKMIPPAVLTDCREKARLAINRKKSTGRADDWVTIFLLFLFGSLIMVFTIWVMKDWDVVLRWWYGWFLKMTKLRIPTPSHGGA